MAISLAESVKHYNNPLATGVAMDMVEVAPVLGMIPWQAIKGNAYTHKFQSNFAGASYGAPNVAIPAGAKTDATIDRTTFNLTSIFGEATVDQFVQDTSVSAGQNAAEFQIKSRAKALARRHSKAMVGGLEAGAADAANAITSLDGLMGSGRTVGDATTDFTLDAFREVADLVLSKDGDVDLGICGRKLRRKILALVDQAGGRTPEYTMWTDPFSGTQRQVLKVEGIMLLVNDHMDETDDLPLYLFNLDDGSKEVGVSFLYPEASGAGIKVENVGISETLDAQIYRVKQYAQLACFNRKAIAKGVFKA